MSVGRDATPRIAIQNRRATVSLGALGDRLHCTFRCPFCYVTGEFRRGGHHDADQLVDALQRHDLTAVDTILVSGDTDSFARPRTAEAVRLVARLAGLGKDVAFTTRAVLPVGAIDDLMDTAGRLRGAGHQLTAITSLTQWSAGWLEPRPTPPPSARVAQIQQFRSAGLRTGVAVRPLLPVIPLDDYTEIFAQVAGVAEFAIIGTWFCDPAGGMAESVLVGPTTRHEVRRSVMDFDANSQTWLEYRSVEAEEHCRKEAARRGVPIFGRSSEAFEWVRGTTHPSHARS